MKMKRNFPHRLKTSETFSYVLPKTVTTNHKKNFSLIISNLGSPTYATLIRNRFIVSTFCTEQSSTTSNSMFADCSLFIFTDNSMHLNT